eukprot:764784-Hanusia_phi.AAC.5
MRHLVVPSVSEHPLCSFPLPPAASLRFCRKVCEEEEEQVVISTVLEGVEAKEHAASSHTAGL